MLEKSIPQIHKYFNLATLSCHQVTLGWFILSPLRIGGESIRRVVILLQFQANNHNLSLECINQLLFPDENKNR